LHTPSGQKFGQLCDIGRNPSRLVFGEQLGCRSPARLILKIDTGERLTVVVAYDKQAGVP
jgi:hypothetical protein